MKAIYQTTETTCLQAVIATLFEQPLENIPDFNKGVPDIKTPEGYTDQNFAIQTWLKQRGLFFVEIALPENFPWYPILYPSLCIIFGELKSGSKHAVVGRLQGEQMIPVFDPLPKAGGLINVESLGFIVPRDPIMPMKMGSALEQIEILCDKTSNPVVKEIKKQAGLALGKIKPNELFGGKWWCNSHQREATYVKGDGTHCCDPNLGGILIPCVVIEQDLNGRPFPSP